MTHSDDHILGILTRNLARAGFHKQLSSQTLVWQEQIRTIKGIANMPGSENWSIALEYTIPRREKRIDAVLLLERGVVAVEFKSSSSVYGREAQNQVLDYALDLRDFHEESFGIPIFPVLLSKNAPISSAIFDPHLSLGNNESLAGIIEGICNFIGVGSETLNHVRWIESGYRAQPGIVSAAKWIFSGHNIRELNSVSADDLGKTIDSLEHIVRSAKEHSQHLVCFVTGVPGSGKTLAGMSAIQRVNAESTSSVFMSGNGPLVKVLREALARDAVQRMNGLSKSRREASLLVQNVHQFLEEYGVKYTNKVPPEHVIAFDEAQRGWDAKKLSKRHASLEVSEAALTLDIMARHSDWSVVIAPVGGGQEIHDGEAGLEEWGNALESRSDVWKIFAAPQAIDGSPGTANRKLFGVSSQARDGVIVDPKLHLDSSSRSPRAQSIAAWVNAVLTAEADLASNIRKESPGYRIYLTRDLEVARSWLKCRASSELRTGLLASSTAARLRPDGIETSPEFLNSVSVERWFLDSKADIRSSYMLEVAMTEFKCQGLELDYAGICWGNDLICNEHLGDWILRRLVGNAWKNVNDHAKRVYLLNKYRVLLTRAREGMIIWVPSGDPNDLTRVPKEFDRTADFLIECGAVPLEESDLDYQEIP